MQSPSNIELELDERSMNFYHNKPISEFKLLDFPRDSEQERKRLQDLGIFFLRDACKFDPIIGENAEIPFRCFFTMVFLNKDGTVQGFHMLNRPTMIEWIKDGAVKRRFLTPAQ